MFVSLLSFYLFSVSWNGLNLTGNFTVIPIIAPPNTGELFFYPIKHALPGFYREVFYEGNLKSLRELILALKWNKK